MRIGLGGLVILFLGCGDGAPCTTSCPKLEGSYAMTYKELSSQSPDCASLTPPSGPTVIEITRSGAEVRATLNGNPGRGMLQDTSDFSISATDGAEDAGFQSLTLRGYFVPPVQRGADGGDPGTIQGKWITHTERGAKVCDAERPCNGVKQ